MSEFVKFTNTSGTIIVKKREEIQNLHIYSQTGQLKIKDSWGYIELPREEAIKLAEKLAGEND